MRRPHYFVVLSRRFLELRNLQYFFCPSNEPRKVPTETAINSFSIWKFTAFNPLNAIDRIIKKIRRIPEEIIPCFITPLPAAALYVPDILPMITAARTRIEIPSSGRMFISISHEKINNNITMTKIEISRFVACTLTDIFIVVPPKSFCSILCVSRNFHAI